MLNEVCCPDGHCPDRRSPDVVTVEKLSCSLSDKQGTSSRQSQLLLILPVVQLTVADENLYPSGLQAMEPELVPDVLRERQHDLPYFFFIEQVCITGNPTPDGLDRRHKILMHHPRLVEAGSVQPQRVSINTKLAMHEILANLRDVPDGMYSVSFELCGSGSAYI